MINRIYKIINSKFSRFFKFVFFLRYLFLIFFVSLVLFLVIPYFFDYKKKEEIIKLYLTKNYSLEIQKLDHIKYQFFPVPQLILDNISGNFYSKEKNLKTEKLILYPKLLSLYNYKNFDLNKVKFDNSRLNIESEKIILITKSLINLKKKFNFDNLDLTITDKKNKVISFKKINLLNYGYKKNKIEGEVFNRKFKVNLEEDLSNINFKLLNTGISVDLSLLKKQQSNKLFGEIRGKILNSKFKFNFNYDTKIFVIDNFFFRGQDLAFESDGKLELKPYFESNFNSKIKNINPSILLNIDIERLLNFRDVIKRLNIINKITYNSKKFSKNLIDEAYISSKLSFGRLSFTKKFLISKSIIKCQSDINLLNEFPIIYFKCKINSSDKKELLKQIGVDYKNKNETLDLNFSGNLNIFNNKINFDNIIMNNNYTAPEEDLKYFKDKFENIVINKKFQNIFDLQKIKKFMKEIV